MKTKGTDWGKIFVNYVFFKRLLFKETKLILNQ